MGMQARNIKQSKYIKLHHQFKSNFKIEPALSSELQQQALKIRHLVYCKELNWEAENSYEREYDEFDSRSLHCLLREQQSGSYIGCVRIIFPKKLSDGDLLPFMLLCGENVNNCFPNPDIPFAEVSRLAILQGHRKKPGPHRTLNFPLLATSLYMGILHLASLSDIEHLYILASASLVVQLRCLGAKVKQIGAPIDHKGLRAPYVIQVTHIIEEMQDYLRPMFEEVAKQINQALLQQSLVMAKEFR